MIPDLLSKPIRRLWNEHHDLNQVYYKTGAIEIAVSGFDNRK